jgi:hypothetical protein
VAVWLSGCPSLEDIQKLGTSWLASKLTALFRKEDDGTVLEYMFSREALMSSLTLFHVRLVSETDHLRWNSREPSPSLTSPHLPKGPGLMSSVNPPRLDTTEQIDQQKLFATTVENPEHSPAIKHLLGDSTETMPPITHPLRASLESRHTDQPAEDADTTTHLKSSRPVP